VSSSLQETYFMRLAVALARLSLCGTLLALVGCGGTVKVDPRYNDSGVRAQGVSQVNILMSDEANKKASDNMQFSRDELASYLRRRLESKAMIDVSATHKVEILVTDIRVRSSFSAIMFGFLAGDDRIAGRIRLLNASGQAVRSFEVNASYAFGGIGGGQDGARMNWLYDKFAELAQIELEKVVVASRPGAISPTSATQATAAVVAAAVSVGSPGTPTANIAPPGASNSGPKQEAVARVPFISDQGQTVYKEYLGQPTPKAFAVSKTGFWRYAHMYTDKFPNRSADPKVRAIESCEAAAKSPCVLYAVDHDIVFRKDASPAEQASLKKLEADEAVPYLSAKGREHYREWLTRSLPRAFAVAPNGYFWGSFGAKPADPALPVDVSERAMKACQRAAGVECKVYAVDEQVVWNE
jgi:hypothetical protein